MKNVFLIPIFLFSVFATFSQTTFVVANHNGEPLKGAEVSRNQKLIGSTNSNGTFLIKKLSIGDTIKFKYEEDFVYHVVKNNMQNKKQIIHFYPPIIRDMEVQPLDNENFVPPAPPPSMPVVKEIERDAEMDQGVVEVAPNYPKVAQTSEREDEIFTMPEISAEFPGGNSELLKFLTNNFRYPERARKEEITGKVYVRFVVEKDGKISDVKVLKGISNCFECDQEAKRMVKMMPNFKPAVNNGKPVRSYFPLPTINFNLQ